MNSQNIKPLTTKRKILLVIPFTCVAGFLIYTWANIILTHNMPLLQHYIGLLAFIPLCYFISSFRQYKEALVGFGIYLVLATFRLLTFEFNIQSLHLFVRFGELKIATPKFNSTSFLLFLLYGVLNFDALVDAYLDYKEANGTL